VEIPVLRAEEVPDEGHAGGAEDAMIQVAATPVAGGLQVCDETRRRRGQLLRASVEEPGIDQPRERVATVQATRYPGCATAREYDRPARLVQFLRDLAPVWPLPTTSTLPGGSAASFVYPWTSRVTTPDGAPAGRCGRW
jgi:hypothetical protein